MRTIETVTKRAEDLTDQDIVYIGRSWVHVSTVECDEHMSVKVRGSVNGGWDKEPTSVTHFYSCFDPVSVQLEVVR